MEAITKIATVNVVRSQRARWLSGHLAQEWRIRFPNLFDDDDLRLANSQPAVHFYEWLEAVVLHHTTGYLSLVEKRIRDASPEAADRGSATAPVKRSAPRPEPGPCAGTRPLDVCGGPLGLVLLRGTRPARPLAGRAGS